MNTLKTTDCGMRPILVLDKCSSRHNPFFEDPDTGNLHSVHPADPKDIANLPARMKGRVVFTHYDENKQAYVQINHPKVVQRRFIKGVMSKTIFSTTRNQESMLEPSD